MIVLGDRPSCLKIESLEYQHFCRWWYGSIFFQISVVSSERRIICEALCGMAVHIAMSSTVVDFGSNRKRAYDVLLATNSITLAYLAPFLRYGYFSLYLCLSLYSRAVVDQHTRPQVHGRPYMWPPRRPPSPFLKFSIRHTMLRKAHLKSKRSQHCSSCSCDSARMHLT